MVNLENVKVGVLGGGVSPEREISLESAKAVLAALERKGVRSVFIDIVTSQKEEVKKLLLAHNLDIVFVALHGEFGEDGKIQKILDEIGLNFTGSGPLASELAMNKIAAKNKFLQKGIPTAGFKTLNEGDKLPLFLQYPLVVKPYYSGSSLGVSIVKGERKLKEAINKAFSYQKTILLEDYIEGRELSVGILGDEPLEVVEIIPKKGHYDFHAKYTDGAARFLVPAPLEGRAYKEVQRIAYLAHQELGCRHFSRVDIRLSTNNIPYVLEVNSIPGLTSHSLLPLCAKAKGLDFDQLILMVLTLALNDTTVPLHQQSPA